MSLIAFMDQLTDRHAKQAMFSTEGFSCARRSLITACCSASQMMLNLMVIRGDGARSQAKLSAGVEVECFLVVKDMQDDSFDVIKPKLGDFHGFWIKLNTETL